MHGLVLAAACPVLSSALAGMAGENTVILPDTNTRELGQFVRYLYGEAVPGEDCSNFLFKLVTFSRQDQQHTKQDRSGQTVLSDFEFRNSRSYKTLRPVSPVTRPSQLVIDDREMEEEEEEDGDGDFVVEPEESSEEEESKEIKPKEVG